GAEPRVRACSASNSNTVSIVGSGTPIVAKHRFAIFAMVSLSIDPDVAASAQQAQMLHGKPRRCDDGWPARPRFDRSTLRAGKNDAMLAGTACTSPFGFAREWVLHARPCTGGIFHRVRQRSGGVQWQRMAVARARLRPFRPQVWLRCKPRDTRTRRQYSRPVARR